MKRLIFIALLLVLGVVPFASAQSCSPYACRLGNCPYTEILIDDNFTASSCHAWSYTGGAAATTGTECNSNNQPLAQLTYLGGFLHTSSVSQTFATLNGSRDLDNFNFTYTIEIDSMTAGDTVKVTVTDVNTGAKITTDTFTTDTWCNQVSHVWNNAGWKGHNLQVKWTSTLADTATTVNIVGPRFWQQYQ